MASGFIFLNDGRCWSWRWTAYDYVLEMVIEELGDGGADRAFGEWLRSCLPGENDIEMGYAFIREGTGENVLRNFDLRELTPANQDRFWKALQRACTKMAIGVRETNAHLDFIIRRLLRMRRLVSIGDHPDHLSDWGKGVTEPPSGNRVGPGWDDV